MTVDDGNGASDSEDITLTVNSVNDTPVLALVGDQSTDEDNSCICFIIRARFNILWWLDIRFTLECTGDDDLVITGCVSTGSETADCTFDVQNDQNGSIDCVVTVDDGNGATILKNLYLVNQINDFPILAFIEDQFTDEDNDLTFIVSAFDVDVAENGQIIGYKCFK